MDFSNKKPFIKDTSNFSSNILTDSTDGLSFSEIKNINLIHYSVRYINKSKNRNPKIPKIYLKTNNNSDIDESNNFLYSFSKRKKISKTINSNNYSLNELYSNSINNIKLFNKIKQPFYKILPQRKDSLIDFKSRTRNIRLLKIGAYKGREALNRYKEKISCNKDEAIQLGYEKNEDKKLINIFNEDLNRYLTFLERKFIKENITTDDLINQKNMLRKEIMMMRIKLDKMISIFEYYLETKSFLLSVKECSIDFNKFSKDSQIEILYDAYKIFNYKTNYYKMDNFNNLTQFKKWIIKFSKYIKGNDSFKKNMYFNYILSSININAIFEK